MTPTRLAIIASARSLDSEWPRDGREEVVALEREQLDVGGRGDRRRARYVAEQGDLAEAFARLEDARRLAVDADLHLARRKHVVAVAVVALPEDDVARSGLAAASGRRPAARA